MTCLIDLCERPAHSRGWCGLHYNRWYTFGDPLAEPPSRTKSLTCENCGTSFESSSARARFCSHACGTKSRRTAPCARCNGPVWLGKGSRPVGEAVCRSCRKIEPVPYGAREGSVRVQRDCPVCGERFYPSAVRVLTCSRACGAIHREANRDGLTPKERAERRRLYWQAKNRRRRALKRRSDAEPYTLAGIAERDGQRCQLCRRKVNMQLKAPHPKSPSIDHVIPIVEGGGDVRANVQLAHWICNVRKGARGSQQLALIG